VPSSIPSGTFIFPNPSHFFFSQPDPLHNEVSLSVSPLCPPRPAILHPCPAFVCPPSVSFLEFFCLTFLHRLCLSRYIPCHYFSGTMGAFTLRDIPHFPTPAHRPRRLSLFLPPAIHFYFFCRIQRQRGFFFFGYFPRGLTSPSLLLRRRCPPSQFLFCVTVDDHAILLPRLASSVFSRGSHFKSPPPGTIHSLFVFFVEKVF